MRVAVIATHFADYSFELSRALAREHQVLLLADGPKLAGEGDAAQLSSPPPRLAITRLPQGKWPVRVMTAAYAAAKLAAFRPDLVIAHEHAHPRVTWLHKVAAAMAPVHLIVHDPDPHTGRDAAFAQTRQRQISAQRGNARRLYAHGPWCAERLALTTPPQTRITSIPHGPIMIPPGPPQPPPGEARMLMFGRMEAYKGLNVLLQACRLLQAQATPLALEIRGHGPELDDLEGGFRDLPGVTVVKGYASRDELIAAMARADLVLAPYHEATQSGVMAAAFANARPMLATAVGGLPDFIRDGVNGRLVAPGDPAALAEAIQAWPSSSGGLWQGAAETAQGLMSWSEAVRLLTRLD